MVPSPPGRGRKAEPPQRLTTYLPKGEGMKQQGDPRFQQSNLCAERARLLGTDPGERGMRDGCDAFLGGIDDAREAFLAEIPQMKAISARSMNRIHHGCDAFLGGILVP